MTQPKNFGFGEEESMVRDGARRFLDEHCSPDKLRVLAGRDPQEAYESATPPVFWDESVWAKAVELGWTALAVPESAGGVGMGLVAVAGLVEEVGRHALPSPLISTLLATYALRAAGTPEAAALLSRVAEGTSATLATTDSKGSWDPSDTDVSARADGGATVLDGTAYFVQDARKASVFVVAARSDQGVGLYAVDADAAGLRIEADRIMDLTRDQARVVFEGVRVEASQIVAAAGAGEAALASATAPMLTIVAADIVGAAEWQLQTTNEYAKIREQFGHSLGFFQAVKHPIVNMMLAVDQSRSLVYDAACAFDTEPEVAEKKARMAKASASDTAAFCSGRSVQLHGGIGFTWECDLHLFFKRQKHNQQYLGDATHHRRKLAEAW